MVNLVYASISHIYEKMAKNEYGVNYLNDAIKMDKEVQADSIAVKFMRCFTDAI